MKREFSTGLVIVLMLGLLFSTCASAQVPDGWVKIGDGGLVDGIVVPGSPYAEKPARNNSYSWSLGTLQCDLDEYLYVGAYRNFPHGAFLGDMLPLPISIPMELFGDNLPPKDTWDMGTVEMMRKNLTQDGAWEVVALPPSVADFSGNQGFRKIYSYKNILYAGTMNMKFTANGWGGVPRIIAISDCCGLPVDVTPTGVVSGDLEDNKAYSYRGMVEHNGVLYAGWEYGVFSSIDPSAGWSTLSTDGLLGYITDLVSFQENLFAVTSDGEDGWRLFKWTPTLTPVGNPVLNGSWEDMTPILKQAIHVGANGFVYDGYLYIATLNGGFPLYDVDLLNADFMTLMDRMLKALVPSYLYRFDGENWETVMGNGTGIKAPGFGVPTNVYIWTNGIHEGNLYLSTFDWRTFFYLFDWDLIQNYPVGDSVMVDVMKNLVSVHIKALCDAAGIVLPEPLSLSDIVYAFLNHGSPVGFDLYKSGDGVNFEPVTQDGFGDPMQYGGRTMVTTLSGDTEVLYLGTSNPPNGTQVWKYMTPESSVDPGEPGEPGEEDSCSGGGCNIGGLFPSIMFVLLPLCILFGFKLME